MTASDSGAPMPTSYTEDPKQAAIDQWTADPCLSGEGEPGSRPYFEDLLAKRSDYAPWMADELDYAGAHELRVLDVGCGQGIDVARYAIAGARATGVDLTPRHVELARRHLEALGLEGEVANGDAESLPFPDGAFDRVSSNGVLHHTPDMPAALREIRRVLVPGGEARIIVYNRASFHYWITQVFERGILQRELLRERSMAGVLAGGVEYSSIGARPLVRVYSPRAVRRLMRDAGFEQVTTTVRHYLPTDTSITRLLGRRVAALRDPAVLDRLGRIGGWYVIGRGRRPVRP
jgi:SAM-dependent methyltransferase